MCYCVLSKETYMKKVYLAGPDVFRVNAIEHGNYLKELLLANGFIGLYPMDNEVDFNNDQSPHNTIFTGNINMIYECDYVLANIDPFRGPSVDPGTAFEIGFASALSKEIVLYYGSHIPELDYETRSLNCVNNMSLYPNIERFGLQDNLMIMCASSSCKNLFEAIEALKELEYFK